MNGIEYGISSGGNPEKGTGFPIKNFGHDKKMLNEKFLCLCPKIGSPRT